MRLAGKLTLVLLLCLMAPLSVDGYLRVAREVSLFETDMRRDHQVLGEALGAAIEAAWRTDGPARALALIDSTNAQGGTVLLRWVWLDARRPDPRAPHFADAAIEPVHRGQEVFRIDAGDGPAGRAYTYVPVALPGGESGALELSESLAPERRYTHASVGIAVGVAGAIAALCAALATGLGVVFVGRPMSRLVEQARRIGRGDLSGRLRAKKGDEIAELAAEMNAMADHLAEANGRVRAEMTARVAALEQLRHADRLTTVGKLASGIAHEMGTPLNVVQGRAKMILGDQASGAGAAEDARIIVEQADRMTRIIRQLLEFARRHEPREVDSDVSQIVRQAIALLAPLAAKRGIALDLDAAGGPQVARVDAGQIQQVLTNLIVNAVQAMPNGGRVTVRVDRSRACAPVRTGRAPQTADYVRVRVEDQGTGMTTEVAARVFEPFFTTKEVGEGTGLGLSVAYGIVEEHDGWIEVESEPGRGSRFTVFLPVGGRA
jgi:signal transduction histidine kinase